MALVFDQMFSAITEGGSVWASSMAMVIVLVMAWSVVTLVPIIVLARLARWWLGNVKPRT